MEIWKAIILGIVQGLTEFLPVSSSGHLILFQRILNVDLEAGEMFLGVMLHLGTLVALLIVFYKEIIGLFKAPKMLLFLLIASIPAAVVGLVFGDKIDEVFYGGKFLCYGFLLTAVLLYATEIFSKKRPGLDAPGYKSSVIMGICQGFAVIPGLSRSGSVIAGGTAARLERGENANFAFLMSIPVIGGAALVEIYKQFFSSGAVGVNSSDLTAVFIGMLFAAVSGFFAIKFMLRIIKKANYKWFSLYLLVLAVVTFLDSIFVFF